MGREWIEAGSITTSYFPSFVVFLLSFFCATVIHSGARFHGFETAPDVAGAGGAVFIWYLKAMSWICMILINFSILQWITSMLSLKSFKKISCAENLHIPLRVVHAQQDYRWEKEVEKELSVRFKTEEGPLIRVVLVQKTDSTVLINIRS